MKITNKYNLPQAIYNTISKVWSPSEERISVISLIGSPLVRRLTIDHWDELEEDASERLWALLGASVHYALEKGSPPDGLEEEHMRISHNGIVISGKSDLYINEGIDDYKVTSVYAFLLGLKPEWTRQQNVYKWMWETQGFPVKTLKIQAILRDWQKGKALTDPDYPEIPFQTVNLPVWSHEKIEGYINDRINLHLNHAYDECTPEEKWTRPTMYAVMKGSNKRASRVLDTREGAEQWIGDQKGFTIVERLGKDVKCEDYCLVKKFCPYIKEGK